MSNIKPFVVNTLPSTLDVEGLYFTKNPLDDKEMIIQLVDSSGTAVKSTPTLSPIQRLEPPLYNNVTLVYTLGELTQKQFFIDAVQVGHVTYTYDAGNLIEKKLYLNNVFSGKIVYTYTFGTFTSKEYSTVE
jgi:hypothetical protein